MSERGQGLLKSSSGVSAAVFCSRLLGLVRSMLEAHVLGGGMLCTAWNFAIMIPSLFRRILGEGALAQALIPLISHTESLGDPDKVRRQLAVVFSALGIIFAVIVVGFSVGAIIALPFVPTQEDKLWVGILPIVMPYSFFICMVGIIGALLNTHRIFFIPALAQLILNLGIIGGLWVLPRWLTGDFSLLAGLSVIVLCSGILQLAMMAWLLYRVGRWPKWNNLKSELPVLWELWHLVLPGLIAASAVQVSFLIDRSLAYLISDYAVPALGYSDRIVYLPLGIFATALGSVLLADMSCSAAQGRIEEMIEDLRLGLRYVFFLCIPTAVFIVLFREEIIRLLFFGGKFDERALQETAWAILFYGLGIPTFCSAKVILPAFYARKKMSTPMKVSFISLSANLVMNLILMVPLAQGGLALATVLSSMLNNGILLLLLRKEGLNLKLELLVRPFCKVLIASLIAGCVYCCYRPLYNFVKLPFGKPDLVPLMVAGIVFLQIYLLLAKVFRCEELPELLSILRRHRKR